MPSRISTSRARQIRFAGDRRSCGHHGATLGGGPYGCHEFGGGSVLGDKADAPDFPGAALKAEPPEPVSITMRTAGCRRRARVPSQCRRGRGDRGRARSRPAAGTRAPLSASALVAARPTTWRSASSPNAKARTLGDERVVIDNEDTDTSRLPQPRSPQQTPHPCGCRCARGSIGRVQTESRKWANPAVQAAFWPSPPTGLPAGSHARSRTPAPALQRR